MKLFLFLHQHSTSYSFEELQWVKKHCAGCMTAELDSKADDLSVKVTKEAIAKSDKVFILLNNAEHIALLTHMVNPGIIGSGNIRVHLAQNNKVAHPILELLGNRFTTGENWYAGVLDFFNES